MALALLGRKGGKGALLQGLLLYPPHPTYFKGRQGEGRQGLKFSHGTAFRKFISHARESNPTQVYSKASLIVGNGAYTQVNGAHCRQWGFLPVHSFTPKSTAQEAYKAPL